MAGPAERGKDQIEAGGEFHVPGFVTITDVSQEDAAEAEYVLSNEATGRHFLANRATVQFFTALRERGSVMSAMQATGLQGNHVAGLLKRLVENGFLVRAGQTQKAGPKPKAPIESKLVSMRWDILDIEWLTRRCAAIGRFAYSSFGCGVWAILMLTMAFQLLANRDKVVLTMQQVFDAGWSQWLLLGALFIGLKIVHEMGHALAYREMCRQEGLSSGPIRVGICIFAFTPFPFTDVTGAWRLRQRWRRVMIGAGGIYFETWIMAALTIIWAETQTGMFQTVILQVAVIAGALALAFNLNPAIKLDGYFMLTDYLRQPNLTARAGLAARTFAARAFGADQPRPNRFELGYWLVSYLYRWTVFAGIFWIIYQFDPRLAPIALAVVVMTLLVRPMMNTAKFLKSAGVRPLRTAIIGLGFAALLTAFFVPFSARVLVPGQYMTFETRFVEATEPGRLERDEETRLVLVNPSLDQTIQDTELQRILLENLKRASFASPQEQASFTSELDANATALARLADRKARLTLTDADRGTSEIWTPLDERWLEGAWVSPSAGNRLGAWSAAADPFLRLRLDATRLTRDLSLQPGDTLRVRLVSDPSCEFTAVLETDPTSAIASGGVVLLHANVGTFDASCVRGTEHGSAVVARLPLGKMSMYQRLRLRAARVLQDRLQLGFE